MHNTLQCLIIVSVVVAYAAATCQTLDACCQRLDKCTPTDCGVDESSCAFLSNSGRLAEIGLQKLEGRAITLLAQIRRLIPNSCDNNREHRLVGTLQFRKFRAAPRHALLLCRDASNCTYAIEIPRNLQSTAHNSPLDCAASQSSSAIGQVASSDVISSSPKVLAKTSTAVPSEVSSSTSPSPEQVSEARRFLFAHRLEALDMPVSSERKTTVTEATKRPVITEGTRKSVITSKPRGGGFQLVGVSQAGAEFGYKFPGVEGRDYIWPEPSGSSAYFMKKGFNVVRLPFLWERLERRLGSAFDATHLRSLHSAVDSINALGAIVIIEPHNSARYHGSIIGSAAVPVQAFARFWTKLATEFLTNDRVIFSLIGEPHSMPTEQWLGAANAAILAIREAGARHQLILVQGNAWSGADSWFKDWYGTPNAVAMLDVNDPEDNYAFDMHQYFDDNYSGKSAHCVRDRDGALARKLLGPATEWLRRHGKRAFLGEIGVGPSAVCLKTVRSALRFMEANSEQWLGFAWWAAGPWWGNYFNSIEPNADGSDKAQMRVLLDFLPKRSV